MPFAVTDCQLTTPVVSRQRRNITKVIVKIHLCARPKARAHCCYGKQHYKTKIFSYQIQECTNFFSYFDIWIATSSISISTPFSLRWNADESPPWLASPY